LAADLANYPSSFECTINICTSYHIITPQFSYVIVADVRHDASVNYHDKCYRGPTHTQLIYIVPHTCQTAKQPQNNMTPQQDKKTRLMKTISFT